LNLTIYTFFLFSHRGLGGHKGQDYDRVQPQATQRVQEQPLAGRLYLYAGPGWLKPSRA